MKVKDKVIIVTGGGNGVGRELVLLLLRRGARVAAIDVNGPALAQTAELAGDMGSSLSTHIIDLTDRQAVEALPAQITARHGVVDGLINNAGVIQPFLTLSGLKLESALKVMAVNYSSVLYMTKAFLPMLTERPQAHIVNVSSMGGFFPVPGQTVYGASKAAVKLLTEGLYAELARSGVKVTVVFPGGIATDIVRHSGQALNPSMERLQKTIKLLTPQKAARIIVNAMERNRYRVFAGIDARFMNLLYTLFPKGAVKLFARIMGKTLLERPVTPPT